MSGRIRAAHPDGTEAVRSSERVANRRAELVLDTPHVRVGNVVCHERRSGPSPTEWTQTAEIVLPRRGVFCVHRSREQIVADTNSAVLFGAESDYRVSHPVDGGGRVHRSCRSA